MGTQEDQKSEPRALEHVTRQAEAELRALARSVFRGERPDHTLQPTALIGELWVRLLESERAAWESPAAFRAWAATAMRHILVDHARRRNALKRGGGRPAQPLGPIEASIGTDLLELDDALNRLAARHERSARVVELRFFGGMSDAAIAERLGISDRTVRSDWSMARAWLYRELRGRNEEH